MSMFEAVSVLLRSRFSVFSSATKLGLTRVLGGHVDQGVSAPDFGGY